ncbi:hypothetical protein JOC85_002416 [Bacillus mesophilus]|uniref:Uncharacterized protein n=1 Tax=Bacillus mesophilus TaxID=1808955 RepID=A0A6M0Q7G2_9BACI|nr:hypothetical protein [Bacillus mesophilus]MBM7661613.1 hypothetical protein [Bacillus mesophilus]NEY72282.1 hypothetical protein [Bacillus mesophilus]
MKKKIIISLIIIMFLPLSFGVITFIQESQKPIHYNGNAVLNLVNIKENKYSQFVFAQKRIKNHEFLEEAFKGEGIDVQQVNDQLAFTNVGERELVIKYPGNDSETVRLILEKISQQYILESENESVKIKELTEDTVQRLKASPTTAEDQYNVYQFIYDLELKLLNWEEATLSNPVSITESSNSPVKRAIISWFLGISIILLVYFGIALIKFVRLK